MPLLVSKLFTFLLFQSLSVKADPGCASAVLMPKPKDLADISCALSPSDTIHPSLKELVEAHVKFAKPVKMIPTEIDDVPMFPSYSKCEKSFFRVATVNKDINQIITKEGWKSGWVRKKENLEAQGKAIVPGDFDGLPQSAPFEDRIIEYVRVKNKDTKFPKDSSVVGILEDPIRTFSVGYHTGYDQGIQGNPMRMDEIEVGECAKAEVCKKITPVSSEKVFKTRGLTPRYSTDGEWSIENQIPPECVVATYRLKWHKVDDVCYSDANNNCPQD